MLVHRPRNCQFAQCCSALRNAQNNVLKVGMCTHSQQAPDFITSYVSVWESHTPVYPPPPPASLLLPPYILSWLARKFIGTTFVTFPPRYKTGNFWRIRLRPYTVPPVGFFDALFFRIISCDECFNPILYKSGGDVWGVDFTRNFRIWYNPTILVKSYNLIES